MPQFMLDASTLTIADTAASACGQPIAEEDVTLVHSLEKQSKIISQLSRNVVEAREKLGVVPALDEVQ
jgi:hypothetical protein